MPTTPDPRRPARTAQVAGPGADRTQVVVRGPGQRPAGKSRSGAYVSCGFVAVAATLAYVSATSPEPWRSGMMALSGILPVVAIPFGLWVHRISDRMPWYPVIGGLVSLTMVNLLYFVEVGLGGATRLDLSLSAVFHITGYVGFLAGSVLVLLRHAPQDGGGVIDAAVLGIGTAAPIWEFLMLPRLAHAPMADRAAVLVQTLVLLGILGSLMRIARTTVRGRWSLGYLWFALCSTVVGIVSAVVTTDPVTGREHPYVVACWIVGYLSLGAAALHPSASDLTRPASLRSEVLSTARLIQLGVFLTLIPLVGAVPLLLRQPPDGLLLILGPLLMTPLVVTRIAQLVAQHGRDQRRLAHQASHDELTGLANRRRMLELLAGAVGAPAAADLAVLYIDLDHFKQVNDEFGHDAGDQVLRTAAERLTAILRDGAVAGRLGGDEFLVIAPGVGPGGIEPLRLRVERELRAPIRWEGRLLPVGASVGAAGTADAATATAADLTAAADADMYARKRAARCAPAAGALTVTGGREPVPASADAGGPYAERHRV